MDIDKIEENLNTYESNPDRVLAIVLNSIVKCQAILETSLDLQVSSMALKLPEEKQDEFVKHAYAQLSENLAKIQGDISAKML